MRLWLSRSSEVPLREQLVTQIRLGIISGDLKVRQKLPSTRELARRFHIHSNTISAAYRELHRAQTAQLKGRIRLVRHHGFDIISDYISDEDVVFFSPDSRFLIVANSKSLRIIDAKAATVLEKIDGIGRPAIFLANGELLTLSADKKSVVLLEINAN